MEPLLQSWLNRVCALLPGVNRALACQDARDMQARVPTGCDAPDLEALLRQAIAQRAPVSSNATREDGAPPKARCVALPFAGGGGFAIDGEVDEERLSLLRCLAAGVERVAPGEEPALSIVDVALHHDRYADAALAVATEIAMRAGCERVSIGFLQRSKLRVEAMSHSAEFRDETALATDVAAAMEEAVDQDSLLVHPPAEAAPLRVTRAHEILASRQGALRVCSIPLVRGGRAIGAMTFEWTREPEAGALALCRQAAGRVGPILALARSVDMRWLERARERGRSAWARLVGPGHVALKAAAIASVLALFLLTLVPGTYKVSSRARLEGRVQRAVVAGFDGYISESHARAGDLVRRGQVLGRLDGRDLSLENKRLAARIEQLRREYREAFAAHDRTQVSIISARKRQAEAQLALIDEQLTRTLLVAPFDGVVVEGDLTQSLGSPVAKGDLLFQVAPLDGYRVILAVDERDIAEVAPGQRGHLALAALPRQPLSFTVERLTPVATQERGHTVFRVEARLDDRLAELRPGMEGIAKVEIDRRRLLWIWTHDLADWLRLQLWSWWP